MPDTLPDPWTWQQIPPFERAVLSGIASAFNGIKFGSRLTTPSDHSVLLPYGVEIWRRLQFGYGYTVLVFCDGHQLVVDYGGSSLDRQVFDLFLPGSIEAVIRLISLVVGSLSDNAPISKRHIGECHAQDQGRAVLS